MLISIYRSFCRAIIRFWDNRFIQSDEINYLRTELAKAQSNYDELINRMMNPIPVEAQQVDEEEWKPTAKYESWESKRRRLEAESRAKAIELRKVARDAILENTERAKTTEELENELGIAKES